MATVFLNGRFQTVDDAKVGALDAGVQHAVGLFETMLGGVREGDGKREAWVIDLGRHMARLAASALALGLSDDLRTSALGEAVMATVEKCGLPRQRVRLTVTGGDLNMLSRPPSQRPPNAADPTVLIVAQPATQYPEAMLRNGVMVTIADAKANPFNPTEGHKTLNYWWRLRELQAAGTKGGAEALVFDVTNHLAGGCVSNCFVRRGNVLLTPFAKGEEGFGPGGPPSPEGEELEEERKPEAGYLPSAVLPGVTRRWVLEQAAVLGIDAERRMLTVSDVLDADEVFLTNSSWGVLPVIRVEGRAIAGGLPGGTTMKLVERWGKWVG